MTQWLPIIDVAAAWPSDPQAVWDDGYRVIAGYAGSQSWKAMTAARIKEWVTPEHPFGIAPMFESTGREAVESPGDGQDHGWNARAAWRALGCPSSTAIAYAVDEDVTMAQITGPVAAYFRGVHAGDGGPLPIAYIENDGGEYLAAHGLISGTFVPAAFGWGSPARLATPDNAPAHALWVQEHNGVSLHGGNVDTGHIRADAPIWWSVENMALSDDDLSKIKALVTSTLTPAQIWGFRSAEPGLVAMTPLEMINQAALAAAKIAVLSAQVTALQAQVKALQGVPATGVTLASDVTVTGTLHVGKAS